MKINTTEYPKVRNFRKDQMLIRFNIVEKEATEESKVSWDCTQLAVSKQASYSDIISGVIRSEYSVDSEFAINNNHNQPNPDEEDIEAYNDYQEYRGLAKVLAKVVLKKYTADNLNAKTVPELDVIISDIETITGADIIVPEPRLKADKIQAILEFEV